MHLCKNRPASAHKAGRPEVAAIQTHEIAAVSSSISPASHRYQTRSACSASSSSGDIGSGEHERIMQDGRQDQPLENLGFFGRFAIRAATRESSSDAGLVLRQAVLSQVARACRVQDRLMPRPSLAPCFKRLPILELCRRQCARGVLLRPIIGARHE